MDKPISIYTDLIERITSLPTNGEDPTLLFADKKNDWALSESMREKFHTVRGVHRLDVLRICNPKVRIMMQELV